MTCATLTYTRLDPLCHVNQQKSGLTRAAYSWVVPALRRRFSKIVVLVLLVCRLQLFRARNMRCFDLKPSPPLRARAHLMADHSCPVLTMVRNSCCIVHFTRCSPTPRPVPNGTSTNRNKNRPAQIRDVAYSNCARRSFLNVSKMRCCIPSEATPFVGAQVARLIASQCATRIRKPIFYELVHGMYFVLVDL